MADNRSTRGRHARRGEAAAGQPERPGTESLAGPSTHPSRRRASRRPGRPVPPPGFGRGGRPARELRPAALRADPGPAAEPAEPISGPIPVVRPAADDATTSTAAAEAPNTIETRARPSAARRCRRRGFRCRSASGAPVPACRCTATAPPPGPGHGRAPRSSRTSPSSGSALRREYRAAPTPCPSWGVPASPPYGFAAAAPAPRRGRAAAAPDRRRPSTPIGRRRRRRRHCRRRARAAGRLHPLRRLRR